MQGPASQALARPRVPRVLVVDDDPEIREIHANLLDDAGLEVLTAENGTLALEMARRAAPDVVVTDLNMPVMDGLDLCRQLRADVATQGIAVVAVTGDASRQAQAAAIEVGCDVILAKPCPRTILLDAIRRLVEQRGMSFATEAGWQ